MSNQHPTSMKDHERILFRQDRDSNFTGDMLLICGGDVITANGILANTDVLLDGGRISAIGTNIGKSLMRRKGKEQLERGLGNNGSRVVHVVDARGRWVGPGMIDMHIHGMRGMMLGFECVTATASHMLSGQQEGSGGPQRRGRLSKGAPHKGEISQSHVQGLSLLHKGEGLPPQAGVTCTSYAAEHEILRQIRALAAALPAYGVTAFLPTFVSLPLEVLESGVSAVARGQEDELGTNRTGEVLAKVLGCHLEGPFLNPKWRGAHSLQNLRKPSVEELRRLMRWRPSSLRVLTIAPELRGAMRLVEQASKEGVVVAASHSDASFSVIKEASKRGLRHIVHLFNGMRRPSHRAPGIVEAGLLLKELTCEIICDGAHVSAESVEIALRCKGTGGLILVSDAVALGARRGPVFVAGRRFAISKGALIDVSTGRLAGGVSSVLAGAHNIHEWMKLSLPEAFRMCSLNVARLLGIDERKGSIQVGKDGDLVILGKDLSVEMTFVEGRLAYSRGCFCLERRGLYG